MIKFAQKIFSEECRTKVWFFKTDWHSSNGRKVAEKFYDEPFEYLNDEIFDTDARNFYIGAAT